MVGKTASDVFEVKKSLLYRILEIGKIIYPETRKVGKLFYKIGIYAYNIIPTE